MDIMLQQHIRKVLSTHLPQGYQVVVFGSRATGKGRTFSDIDVGIIGKDKVPLAILSDIKGDFEESSLPYHVDVVDFQRVSENFRKVAEKKMISIID